MKQSQDAKLSLNMQINLFPPTLALPRYLPEEINVPALFVMGSVEVSGHSNFILQKLHIFERTPL